MGGIFLVPDGPMEKRSVLALDFLLREEGKEIKVQAKAVVRWPQRFRKPTGLGVEYYDLTGCDGLDIEQCFEKLFQELPACFIRSGGMRDPWPDSLLSTRAHEKSVLPHLTCSMRSLTPAATRSGFKAISSFFAPRASTKVFS